LGVSRQGEFKNTKQILLQKVHVENFFQQKSTKISMSVFPRLPFAEHYSASVWVLARWWLGGLFFFSFFFPA
jgi:hypothetical protein